MVILLIMVSTTFVETVRVPGHLRIAVSSGILRALYVTAPDKRVTVFGAFVKKTQRTSTREIALMLQRARRIMP